jgi:hypothetical protein
MICLISVIDSSNPKLFKHFLDHYSAFGINHFYCCFHSVSPKVNSELEECLDLFQKHSKGRYILYLGEEFNSFVKHKKIMILSSMSEADGCKWKVTVDCDEFYILREAIEDFIIKIEPYDAIRSILVDRLANHGFPSLNSNKNLFKQFPLNAFVTNSLLHGTVSKVFICRNGFDVFPGAHLINNRKVKYFPGWLTCYHFKWHNGCIERLEKRRDVFKKNNLPWWVESDTFIKNYTRCWEFIAKPQTGKISSNFRIVELHTKKNLMRRVMKKITINLEKGF